MPYRVSMGHSPQSGPEESSAYTIRIRWRLADRIYHAHSDLVIRLPTLRQDILMTRRPQRENKNWFVHEHNFEQDQEIDSVRGIGRDELGYDYEIAVGRKECAKEFVVLA